MKTYEQLMKHYWGVIVPMAEAAGINPWKLWEWKDTEFNWTPCKGHPSWLEDFDYRQIPQTILINGHEVPEPMREKPEIGTEYIFVDFIEKDLCGWHIWRDDVMDNRLLSIGICHLTRDNCIAHAKALFSFSEVG